MVSTFPPPGSYGPHHLTLFKDEYSCRSCGQVGVKEILSLGHTPLANALLSKDQLEQPEENFPLELVLCPSCSLVQITETVPPEKMFSDYAYFSSFSDTMLQHASTLVTEMIGKKKLGQGHKVIEVASNDGYLLQYYAQQGVEVLGIEPAANIAKVAREEKGLATITEFFGLELAQELAEGGERADVIHAHNVLAHVPDLNGFVEGFATLLKDDGHLVVEFPYLKDLIDKVEFDTIYHEHLCYFSLTAINELFQKHGLKVVDVKRVEIHGGSLRIYAQRLKTGTQAPTAEVAKLLAEEQGWGVTDPASYESFRLRVTELRDNLVSFLQDLRQDGKRIAVYGASAKGSTLLNAFGIGSELIDYVVDRSTVKQGRYTPGTHLQIFNPAKLTEDKPDYVLLLTWNFEEEILKQQQQYRSEGGKFIIPIPNVKVA